MPTAKKVRLEKRADKKMGRAKKIWAQAEGAKSDALKSGSPMDYAGAEQLYKRAARKEAKAKALKSKASSMKEEGGLPEASLGSIIKGGYKLLKGADKIKKIKSTAKTVKGKIVKPKKPKTFAEKRKMVAERNDNSLKAMGKAIGKAALYGSIPLGAEALWIASDIAKKNKKKGTVVKKVVKRSKKPTIKSSAAPRITKKK